MKFVDDDDDDYSEIIAVQYGFVIYSSLNVVYVLSMFSSCSRQVDVVARTLRQLLLASSGRASRLRATAAAAGGPSSAVVSQGTRTQCECETDAMEQYSSSSP